MPDEEEQESTEESEETKTEPDITKLLEEAKKAGKEEAKEEYKGIQRTIATKDSRIKELETRPAPTVGVSLNRQTVEAMETGDYEKAKALIAQQEQEQTRQGRIQQQSQITQGHRDRIRQEIVTAGHNPDDEIFEDVMDAIDLAGALDGKFDRVDRKLTRVLKANPKESKTTDTPTSADIDAAKEEGKRQALEEKGLLKTESGLPSASGQSNEDFQQAFIRGDYRNKLDEYEAEARKRGLI